MGEYYRIYLLVSENAFALYIIPHVQLFMFENNQKSDIHNHDCEDAELQLAPVNMTMLIKLIRTIFLILAISTYVHLIF